MVGDQIQPETDGYAFIDAAYLDEKNKVWSKGLFLFEPRA